MAFASVWILVPSRKLDHPSVALLTLESQGTTFEFSRRTMADEYKNDNERLNGVIGVYRAKKAELFPDVEDLTPAEALSLSPESVLFVDARSDGGEPSHLSEHLGAMELAASAFTKAQSSLSATQRDVSVILLLTAASSQLVMANPTV